MSSSPVLIASPPAAHDLPDLEAATGEHYADGLRYDHEYKRRRSDVSFYRELSRELAPERVLELGCGTGRVTLPLARDGHTIVGFDLSQPMLARARTRARQLGRAGRGRCSFARADMRQFAVGRRVDLVLAAFNTFEHLYTRTELTACLRCVRDSLRPGGRLVFDVQNPSLRWLVRSPEKRWARTRFKDPRTGTRIEYSTSHVYEPISQIAYIKLYYQTLEPDPAKRTLSVVRLAQRKFFPAELDALLAHNGFAVEHAYGDFARAPLDGDAESQVLVCRPR
jgi:SAM-dependent methyltransferase